MKYRIHVITKMKIKDYRGRFHFKIGTTSYIFPYKKDNLVRNVRHLCGRFDKVQLLFFGKNYLDEVMSPKIIDELHRMRMNTGIDYVIHLPVDFRLLNENSNDAAGSIDIIMDIFDKTSHLGVKEYILHIDSGDGFSRHDINLTQAVRDQFLSVLEMIGKRLKTDINRIFIENIGYDLTCFKDIIKMRNYNVCMDIGHLFHYHYDFNEFITTFNSMIRLVHLHGFNGGVDHISLGLVEPKTMGIISEYLQSYNETIIIEVFNYHDLKESMNCLMERVVLI